MDEGTEFLFSIMLPELWEIPVEGSEKLERLEHFEILRNQASAKSRFVKGILSSNPSILFSHQESRTDERSA